MKGKSVFFCTECGNESSKWLGQCPACHAWNTFAEEPSGPKKTAGAKRFGHSAEPVIISQVSTDSEERILTGIHEFDRVLGGGIVVGSLVLVGGDPGIGKSTLLLQVCAAMADKGKKVLYISGEESSGQIALRGRRLGLMTDGLDLLCENDLPAALEAAKDYDFVVVDSVQAFRTDEESGWAGSPSQVKQVAQMCVDMAKGNNIPTVLVGHITKSGQIAGPKLLEHQVDVVLLFTGENDSPNRLLRAEKNRYGSTEELGIFEMTDKGLSAISDPSKLYWNGNDLGNSGVAIALSLEGSRSIAAEIQSLATSTPFPYPKRTARGIETNRLQLLLAVLERRCGVFSRNSDVYLNVAAGLNLKDPAADLAICASLASALKDVALPADVCFVGEVGLAGEVRPAARTRMRLKEAARIGFKRAVISRRTPKEEYPLEVIRVSSLRDMLAMFVNK